MMKKTQAYRPRRAGDPPRDAGMTLVEVIVAFGLFAIFATAALVILNASIGLSRDDASRLSAANLASRELEVAREIFSSPVRGPEALEVNTVTNPTPLSSADKVGDPLVVNNVPFTVVRSAQWAAVGGAASTCDDGTNSELAYLRLKVEVSWPSLGTRPPVTMYTTMTPPKGTYSNLAGHLGIKVVDSQGLPRGGVTVTATGPTPKTGVTGADGCALLAFLDPGSYQVSLSGAGFVTPSGSTTGATTVQVESGKLLRKTVDYDRAATIQVTFVTDSGHALPILNDLPVMLSNSGIQPTGRRAVAGPPLGSNARTLTDLWPYASGYQLWAGQCPDNDPEYSGPTSEANPTLVVPSTRDAAVGTPAGGVASATVRLVPVTVVTSNKKVLYAHQKPNSNGCEPGATVRLGIALFGKLNTSLPIGTWQISEDDQYKDGNKQGDRRSARVDAPQRAADGTLLPQTPVQVLLDADDDDD